MGFRLQGNYENEFRNRLELMTEALEKPIGIEGSFDVYDLSEVSENFDKDAAIEFLDSLRTEQVISGINSLHIAKEPKCTIGRKKKKITSKISTETYSTPTEFLSFMDID